MSCCCKTDLSSLMINVPYMKDVFNKPCISQASTRNSTMLWNYGQYCISFLAPSIWNNLPNEVKRCTNLNTFKHKVKEYFLYKIRQKDNYVYIFTTTLLSSQKLMHFFFNFSLLLLLFSFFFFWHFILS